MSATPGPTRPQGTEQQFTVPVPVAPTNAYAGQPVWAPPAQPAGGALANTTVGIAVWRVLP